LKNYRTILCPALPTKIILSASAGSKQDYAHC
jgi:hypothetical protein